MTASRTCLRSRFLRDRGRQMGLLIVAVVVVLTGTVAVSLVGPGSAQVSGNGGRTDHPRRIPSLGTAANPSQSVPALPGPALGLKHTLPVGYDSGVHVSLGDIPYGPDPAQQLDLYLPDRVSPAPVLVYFHAGGWIGGDRTGITQVILREVLRGYGVASVEYRLAPRFRFPVALQDAKTAVRWVKAHATEYNLRSDEVFATGASAGGHLAAMVAATPGLFEPTNLPPTLSAENSRVVGAVSLVGPLDLNAIGREVGTWGPPLVSALLGCSTPPENEPATCSADAMAAASPVTYVSADDPPIYLGYGVEDTLVPPNTNGEEMALDYARLGKRLDAVYEVVQNQGHNIDIDGIDVTTLDRFLDRTRTALDGAGTLNPITR